MDALFPTESEQAALRRLLEFIRNDPEMREMTAPQIGFILRKAEHAIGAFLSVATIADMEARQKEADARRATETPLPVDEYHTDENVWEDGTNEVRIAAHFGYTDMMSIQTQPHGYWPRETTMERVKGIPDALALMGAEKRKFRIVLDYDPEFPRAMLQIQFPD